MNEIILQIAQINDDFGNAKLSDAYQRLHKLTADNDNCREFYGAAKNILSEHNQLETAILEMSLDLTSQELKRREIKAAFLKLISKIEQQFKPSQEGKLTDEDRSVFEKQKEQMEGHREALRGSLTEVENQIIDCINPKKLGLLKEIKATLQQTIDLLFSLIRSFSAVCQYE